MEKVLKGLQCCQVNENGDLESCPECPYNEVSMFVEECRTKMCRDALKLLKCEIIHPYRKGFSWRCECGRRLWKRFNYCPDCGGWVNWNV